MSVHAGERWWSVDELAATDEIVARRPAVVAAAGPNPTSPDTAGDSITVEALG
jgi:hypothetical protein